MIHSALRFVFWASNKEAEYEAFLGGLWLARAVKAERIDIFSDFQLIVYQDNNEYQLCEDRMVSYLQAAKDELSSISKFTFKQIPKVENSKANALAWLATLKDAKLLQVIPIKVLMTPSINKEQVASQIANEPN